jgi:hypothetical protein
MTIVQVSRAVLVAAAISLNVVPAATQARPLGTVEGLPFWGRPFPYGYTYHRPPEHCIHLERIEAPFAPPVTEVTWVCGGSPVSARY